MCARRIVLSLQPRFCMWHHATVIASCIQAVAAPPQRPLPTADTEVSNTHKYCESTWQTRRRPTRTVNVSVYHSRPACSTYTLSADVAWISLQNALSLSFCEGSDCTCLQIGGVKVGSDHKIALQTMTTTDTRDIEGTVDQVSRCSRAGQDMGSSVCWKAWSPGSSTSFANEMLEQRCECGEQRWECGEAVAGRAAAEPGARLPPAASRRLPAECCTSHRGRRC